MKPLAALTSVLTTATFHASITGEILETNAPFVQLMRCVPGDDWRMNVDEREHALLTTFWDGLFTKTDEMHQPVAFYVNGSDHAYQIRAQAVTNDDGEYVSAVGVVIVDESTPRTRWSVDSATGLPEHNAVFERFDELSEDDRSFVAAVVLLDDEDADDELRRKEAARQLLAVIRPNDMLASDVDGRFLLCAPGINSGDAALALAQRLSDSLSKSSIVARIGLALPHADVATATMVREAEAGAYASADGQFGFAPSEDAA